MARHTQNNPRYNKAAARRAVSMDRPATSGRGTTPTARRAASAARPTSRGAASSGTVSAVRLGDMERAHRVATRRAAVKRKWSTGFKVLIALIITAVLAGGTYAVLYFSPVFAIQKVTVTGADHLTGDEMAELAIVPQGTTLLNVDAAAIENSVVRDSWVSDVRVIRHFPDTLEIAVTERRIAAVVDVAADNAKTTQHWAIASDGMWLMEIPDQDSELGQAMSPQIFADAAAVLHIKDVPFGLAPQVGTYCTDDNVNNALQILDGLSTDLVDQVKTVSATDAQSTLITLENGIEIAFGTADDIREKERICLEIMAENPDKVAYINVRVPDRPTWRSL